MTTRSYFRFFGYDTSLREMPLEILNKERWFGSVNHRMTVRTNRPQITHRIYFIFISDRSNGNNVMHMYKALTQVSEYFCKIKTAHIT